MASFNKVILMGNLTRDPQLRYLPSQMAVVEFGLACNRKFKDQERRRPRGSPLRRLHRLGQAGRDHQPVLPEGQAVFIEGRLKYDTWEDKQGGGKRSKLTRRRRELPVPRPRATEAGGGAGRGQDSAARINDPPRVRPARGGPASGRRRRQRRRPSLSRTALRRRTAVQGRRYSVLRQL